nr:heterotrimeric G-protein alpha subunit [Chara braunii]
MKTGRWRDCCGPSGLCGLGIGSVRCAMGCCLNKDDNSAQHERTQNSEIDKQIKRAERDDKQITKILLLGAGESGKSTIFKQIKVLFQRGFSDEERSDFKKIVHVNVYQSIKVLLDGRQDFFESDSNPVYSLLPGNERLAQKISDIANLSSPELPDLNGDAAAEIDRLWKDPGIQATFRRANELQLPDCAQYFFDNIDRIGAPDYIPTQEDVLFARIRTTGVAETEFVSPENPKLVYRVYDVGGQRNERRKWLHLFDGVSAIIFCVALSEYDQLLFEDESVNRMMETKQLFESVLQEQWFKKTAVMVFLNKFDIFRKKVTKVSLSKCEWFSDYRPVGGAQEVEHAYRYVARKFEDLFRQHTSQENYGRVFEVHKSTATDTEVVRRIFDAMDRAFLLQRLMEMDGN